MPDTFLCAGCGSACRPSDRFCSQCGRRSPADAGPGQETSEFAAGSTTGETRWDDLVAVEDPPLAPGTVFARRYRIERMLGQGGMGRVYLAVDTTIHEPVALKLIAGSAHVSHARLEQFTRELKLARRIRHRNVVASFHLGRAEGSAYIVQEYIDADSLSTIIHRRGRLPEPEALALLRQVLYGLKAAHDLNIVHRDIKAGNILVNKDGLAFITDFGLALSAAESQGFHIAGTPEYMAPELFEGLPATPVSDLYACGVLLYHMLSGSFPFTGHGFEELARIQRSQPLPAIPDTISVSEATKTICTRMLEKSARRRPQTTMDVLDLVDSVVALDALAVDPQRPVALVADGDDVTRGVARERLESEGYHVEEAKSAQQTLELAFSIAPYLVVLSSSVEGGKEIPLSRDASNGVLSDLLARHGGLGVCRVLQHDAKLKQVPVLVVAPHSHPGLKSAFMLMGAAEVISKPFTSTELADGIRRARQNVLARAGDI